MVFDELLGNEQLKADLLQSLRRGRASHFYLICGPDGSGRHTLARLLAAALMCEGDRPPCGTCDRCRKVLSGVHPDFITVDDPEKKTVPVDLIRQARADIYIQPNEGKRKIYLFPRAQDMGIPGQNALLKILEEPPEYGVFLLVAGNPEALLPTVRSRCTELTLQPLPEAVLRRELEKRFPKAEPDSLSAAIARSDGYLGQAIKLLEGSDLSPQTVELLRALQSRDSVALLQGLVPMEKWKRDALIEVLRQLVSVLQQALVCRSGGRATSEQARLLASSHSSAQLLRTIEQLQKCITYAQGNVSPAAICGYLQWALR